MNTYQIYHITSKEQEIIDFSFEAEDRESAYARLLQYQEEHSNDGNTYLYKTKHNFALIDNDGNTKYFDSFSEMMNYKKPNRTISEKIRELWTDIEIWFQHKHYQLLSFKSIFTDFFYWVKNYSSFNNTSHMRSESWSLDYHIIEDLAFNIPIIQDALNSRNSGIPDYWCQLARTQLKERDENYTVPEDIEKHYSYTNEEFDLAKNLWISKMDEMMKFIGYFHYLENYGNLEEDEYIRYKLNRNDKDFPQIPYYDGTKEIKYDELHKMNQEAYKNIWMWFIENGRFLWT